jgi:hypothetical protein
LKDTPAQQLKEQECFLGASNTFPNMGIYEFIAIKKGIRDNQQGASMPMVGFEDWWGITKTPIYQPTNLPLIDKRERMFEE